MARDHSFSPWRALAFLAGVSALSAAAARPRGRVGHERLGRAPGAPPGWAFPLVWSGLSLLQGLADLRILNDRRNPDRNTLLGLRALSWGLFALATPAFRRVREPGAGEAAILAEGVVAGATLALVAKRDRIAAAALAPLTLWTAYAGLVGGWIAARHPDRMVDRLRFAGGL
jgi:tryptophan-rich sensory protein